MIQTLQMEWRLRLQSELQWSQRIRDEVEDLHDFFERWLSGSEGNPASLKAETQVLDRDFAMVTPQGIELEREQLLERLSEARGKGPRRIWVEQIPLLWLALPLIVARYDECQESRDGEITRRVSTAIFREGEARHGLIWCRVHETWVS